MCETFEAFKERVIRAARNYVLTIELSTKAASTGEIGINKAKELDSFAFDALCKELQIKHMDSIFKNVEIHLNKLPRFTEVASIIIRLGFIVDRVKRDANKLNDQAIIARAQKMEDLHSELNVLMANHFLDEK